MDKTKLSAEEIAAAEAAKKAEDDAKAKADADSQDPLKKERERIASKGAGRSQKEKLLFSKKKIDEQLAALDDEGEEPADDLDDDKPLTVKDLKNFRREEAKSTAINMAEDIDDEDERELVKHHLSNTIKPSGNAAEDLKNARAIVNSAKNGQIIEEVTRRREPKNHASGAGAGGKKQDDVFTPTAEEANFMRTFGLTEKDILNARKIEEAKRQ